MDVEDSRANKMKSRQNISIVHVEYTPLSTARDLELVKTDLKLVGIEIGVGIRIQRI